MRGVSAAAALVIAASSFAHAQLAGQAVRAVTDRHGAYLVSENGKPLSGSASSPESILWMFSDPVAIAEHVAISQSHAWVGQHLNNRRLQRFAVSGNGTPLAEFPGTTHAVGIIAAAREADLVVYMDRNVDTTQVPPVGTEFVLRAYRAAGASAAWSFTFPITFNGVGPRNVQV
jgi:hypothetical protein